MEKPRLTLYELNLCVGETIEHGMPGPYWVEAELSECRENANGHCYMNLIEKSDNSTTPIASARAICWKSNWPTIRNCFENATGQRLQAGMKVLLKVRPRFHEAYGFSWIVGDIDPTYTLGDMARKRQEIVRQLNERGLIDMQKKLHLPLFCQRIAIISSSTAAGYGDFCKHLNENPYGLAFTTRLFQSVMQGEDTGNSIIAALESIAAETDSFDCVVIIRGGGETSDLSGFDTLPLATRVATFALPVVTGIGHERDASILDMVSFAQTKTPTAAAAMLIDHLKHTLDILNNSQERINLYARRKMQELTMRLATLTESVHRLFSVVKVKQESQLDTLFAAATMAVQQRLLLSKTLTGNLEHILADTCRRKLVDERHRIELLTDKTKLLDPAQLLKRGYSITLHGGKAVRDSRILTSGDEIETRFLNGTIKSIVK